MKKAKDKLEEVKEDIRESVNKHSERLLELVKERFITEAIKEAFDAMKDIMGA